MVSVWDSVIALIAGGVLVEDLEFTSELVVKVEELSSGKVMSIELFGVELFAVVGWEGFLDVVRGGLIEELKGF